MDSRANNLNSNWKLFLEEVHQLLPSSNDYHLWFEPIQPVELDGNMLTIMVPSKDYYDKMENVYLDIVRRGLVKVFGDNINLSYQIPNKQVHRPRRAATIYQDGTSAGMPLLPPTSKEVNQSSLPNETAVGFATHLDERHTMDNFLQSFSNRLAYTAACTIIEKPGENAFNPLFVHGASGVGKTHLLHAIGNALMSKRKDYKAVYVPAQTFKRQYVEATIARKQPELFFNYYQNIDLLLIDDIQEFSEAMSTQNAFFQIFNNLKLLGKQIIITSDRPPVELKGMEERLYTRLKWGLTAEIERPDIPLRRMILESKVKQAEIDLPSEVFDFIVKHAKDNIRDIEGSLTSIIAHSLYNDEPISLSLAERVMAQTVGIEPRKINIPDIIKTVCKYYNLDKDDVIGRKRKREIVQARQIIMLFAKKYTDAPLASIGAELGGRDHSTIIYGLNAIDDLLKTDTKVKKDVAQIDELLDV